jgi:hypothetical protein
VTVGRSAKLVHLHRIGLARVRIYIVSAVVLLGITGAAGYYYYDMTCCAPPPVEHPRIDQGK